MIAKRVCLSGAALALLIAACGLNRPGYSGEELRRRLEESSSQVFRAYFSAAAADRIDSIHAMSSTPQPAEWAERMRSDDPGTMDAALQGAKWLDGYYLAGDTILATFSIPQRRFQDQCYTGESGTDEISLRLLHTRKRVSIIRVSTNTC